MSLWMKGGDTKPEGEAVITTIKTTMSFAVSTRPRNIV